MIKVFWITDSNFILPTYISMQSFVDTLFEYSGTVELNLFICGSRNQYVEIFKNIDKNIVINNTELCKHSLTYSNRIIRTQIIINSMPEDIVVLMDSDTIIIKANEFIETINNINKHCNTIFNNKKSFIAGVIENQRAVDNLLYFIIKDFNGYFSHISQAEKNKYYKKIFGNNWKRYLSSAQLNNGVLIFKNCSDLALKWQEYYLKGIVFDKVNPEDDQVPLAAAINSSDTQLILLSSYFNSLGTIFGNYAIFHPYAGIWKFEYLIAKENGFPQSDFSQIVKKYLSKIPNRILLPCYKFLNQYNPYICTNIEESSLEDVYAYINKKYSEYRIKIIDQKNSACFLDSDLITNRNTQIVFIINKFYHDYISLSKLFLNIFLQVKSNFLIIGRHYNISPIYNIGVKKAVDDFCIRCKFTLEVNKTFYLIKR